MNDDMKKDRYGINIKKWCISHERMVESALAGSDGSSVDPEKLLKLHEKRLSCLMHERLIHLIVLFITVVLALFSLGVILLVPDAMPYSLVLFAIVFVLLIFYVRHYFFLENTVQHWYVLDEKIRSRIG